MNLLFQIKRKWRRRRWQEVKELETTGPFFLTPTAIVQLRSDGDIYRSVSLAELVCAYEAGRAAKK